MKKRIISLLVLLAMVMSILSGCNFKSSLSDDEKTSQDNGNENNAENNNSENDKDEIDNSTENDNNVIEDDKTNSETEEESLSVSFGDLTLAVGEKAHLITFMTVGEKNVHLYYTFSDNNVSFENGTLTALAENTATVVTVSTDGFTTTFKVEVVSAPAVENPEPQKTILSFGDVAVQLYDSKLLPKNVVIGEEERALTYSFDGNAISIENYVLKGIVKDTETMVTAKTDGFEASFKVKVSADPGTMTIDAPKSIYTNYASKPITPIFSNPAFASEVTYTASDSRVKFDEGGIYATGSFGTAVNVTVTAESKYHSATFTVKVSEFNLNNDESAVKYYEENIIKPENKGGTIFIGDSYFSGQLKNGKPSFWSDFYEDYTDGKTFLMGISGSQIVNWEVVAERIVYPMEPKEIVLHIGFNDVHSSNRSAYEIATRIIAMLEEFREKLPDTKIYYCSVEPKKNALDSGSQFYEKSMIYAPMINTMLEAYTYENTNVTFVNTRQLFFNEDGTINRSYYLSTDLSHPTLEAYEAYRKLIEQARGNIVPDEKPEEISIVDLIKANQSEISAAAAQAKLNSSSYTIENNPSSASGQTLAHYFKTVSGDALKNYYSVSGYMQISDLQSNGSHVQFRFSNTTNDRFLLYDSNSNKKLGICAPFDGKSNEASTGSVADALDVSAVPQVLKWQVIVTEKTAYFFVNDVLVLYGVPGALNYFNISVEKADIEFWGIEIVVKAENTDLYQAILEKNKIS